MLKITNHCPLCPAMTIDTNDVNMGHGVMTQLGFGPDAYRIEVFKMPHDESLPATGSRSVRITEASELTTEIQVQFLDDNKVVGIDWFSQRDCVNLFRFSFGWMDLSLTHLKLRELITRRILHR